ncbi:MAG: Por secretion system C-terminal sorting domain protein [Bacteroidetes bacterium]|nr:MAG: Por secretion system C-terminal sorting domain protein [Bacteroidota bacterium]
MRKVCFLIMAMLFTTLSYSQVYLYEDFSAGTMPPAGWSFEGLPNQWSNSPSNNAGGVAPEAKFSYINQNTTSRFVSPVVDMTGVPNATLSFKYFYDWYANGPTIGVATRFGTGAWTVAWQVSPTGNQGPKTQIVSLNNIGQNDFQFCIFITGNLYNVDYWFIDNIKLFTPLNLDASLASVNIPRYVEAGDQFDLKGVVSNEGATAISSFTATYTVDGGVPQVQSFVGLNITLGNSYSFTHNTPITLSDIGSHEIVTTITNVNGGDDLDPSNNTVTKIVGAVSFVPVKKVLAEEATGTWCGWCVRGICFMDYMAETYPETWIGVAVHNADPMVNDAYDNAIPGIIPGFAGYPSVTSDRTAGDSDPSDLETGYQRRLTAISPATLEIVNYGWNPETREVTFDLQSEFVADINSELRFGVIFVEDSLWGTTSQWNQANYYAGGGNGAMCGFENMAGTIPAAQMHYDHVAREILDSPFGTEGSLPLNIATGSVITYNYTYTLPDNWKYDKLHIVGFLLDVTTGEIINANNVISTYVGVNNPAFDKGVAVYPNPLGDYTNVSFNIDSPCNAGVEVYDLFGKKVLTVKAHEYTSGQNMIRVSSNDLANGMYVLRLKIGNQVISRKISVIR